MAPFLCLATSLLALPIAYVFLCKWMSSTTPNPPKRPFFFIFGSVGGYLLLLAFGPSFLSLLLFFPFLFFASIAVLWSLVTSLLAKPRTKFHKASAITSGLLILLMIWCAVSISCGGLSYSGDWHDDPENWSRAMGGQAQPKEVHMLHSQYWRSPHFTYEAICYFEFTAPAKFLQDWIAFQKLVATPPTQENTRRYSDAPTWFIPKPLTDYEMWMPAGDSYDNFRIYRDRTTGTMYVTSSQL